MEYASLYEFKCIPVIENVLERIRVQEARRYEFDSRFVLCDNGGHEACLGCVSNWSSPKEFSEYYCNSSFAPKYLQGLTRLRDIKQEVWWRIRDEVNGVLSNSDRLFNEDMAFIARRYDDGFVEGTELDIDFRGLLCLVRICDIQGRAIGVILFSVYFCLQQNCDPSAFPDLYRPGELFSYHGTIYSHVRCEYHTSDDDWQTSQKVYEGRSVTLREAYMALLERMGWYE